MRRYREIAEAWQTALAEARRGEFGHAHENLDRAERLAGGAGVIAAKTAVAAARREFETKQQAAAPKVEALYSARWQAQWPQTLAAAEAVLALIPDHPAARQARPGPGSKSRLSAPRGSPSGPSAGARAAGAATLLGLGPGPEGPSGPQSTSTKGPRRGPPQPQTPALTGRMRASSG